MVEYRHKERDMLGTLFRLGGPPTVEELREFTLKWLILLVPEITTVFI